MYVPAPPVRHAVPGGELSTIYNGRYWETVFFRPSGDNCIIHDLHGVEDAAAFAAKLNAMSDLAAASVLRAYERHYS